MLEHCDFKGNTSVQNLLPNATTAKKEKNSEKEMAVYKKLKRFESCCKIFLNPHTYKNILNLI